jgi:chromosome segregation ATPase
MRQIIRKVLDGCRGSGMTESFETTGQTCLQLEAELERLDAHIRQLRGERSAITYDLEQCTRERERLKRNLAALLLDGRGA